MFFDYALIFSLSLSALLLAVSAWFTRTLTDPKLKWTDLQKKIKLQQKIFYFFILSIFFTRLIFIAAFPEQLVSLFRFNGNQNPLLIWLLVMEGFIAFLYLLFLFFFYQTHELKPPFRKTYTRKLLTRFHLFLSFDLIISVISYLLMGWHLAFPNSSPVLHTGLENNTDVFAFILAGLLLLLSVSFWLVQKKRNQTARVLFVFFLLTSAVVSIFLGLRNIPLLFSSLNLLQLFTFTRGFYGPLWLLLFFTIMGSEIIALTVHALKEEYINRYFALNMVLQLNRIAFICAIGLIANAALPQLIFVLI